MIDKQKKYISIYIYIYIYNKSKTIYTHIKEYKIQLGYTQI